LKLLITGGCGFLGSNLAAYAIKKKLDVTIFDNLSRKGASDNLNWLNSKGKFDFHYGDIRNSNDVERLVMKQFDVIFNLAGQVAMTTSINNPRLDFETNTLGCLNVLESVRKYSPQTALFYSSTNKVYGDLEQYTYKETDTRYYCEEYPDGFNEGVCLDFHSPYGCSKGAADQYMQDYYRMYGIKTVVFRHSSMYGGRQFATYDQGWVGWFCQQAILQSRDANTSEFTISGNGKQVRDILHADDMVSLYFLAIEHIEKIAGNAFNIGGSMKQSLSILELMQMLQEQTNTKLKYTHINPRESDQKVFVADIRKIKNMTGWQPTVSSEQGIKNMLEWIDTVI
jgi:CDP-paratose 2-epimerase